MYDIKIIKMNPIVWASLYGVDYNNGDIFDYPLSEINDLLEKANDEKEDLTFAMFEDCDEELRLFEVSNDYKKLYEEKKIELETMIDFMDHWQETSNSVYDEFSKREIDMVCSLFTNNYNENIYYRVLAFNYKTKYEKMSDEELIKSFNNESKILASSTKTLAGTKKLVSDNAECFLGDFYVIVEVTGEEVFDYSYISSEEEVIIKNPTYKKIILKEKI